MMSSDRQIDREFQVASVIAGSPARAAVNPNTGLPGSHFLPPPYWAVAQTEPQREHIARLWLMRLGYETYAPRVRLRRGRVVRLFPTYIFVRVFERFYPILWTPGILRLLMAGQRPARLPASHILALTRR